MYNHNKYILTSGDDILLGKVKTAIEEVIAIINRDMPKYSSGNLYPGRYKDGKYSAIKNGEGIWTESFWTGMLWLAYEITGKEEFCSLAQKNVDDFVKRMDDNNNIDWHHDIGFLYSPSCVASYKLTGNEKAKKVSEEAAYLLNRRFRIKGNFIQSAGIETDEPKYKFIIDTMLNLPLLFWAADETGRYMYRQRAILHAETARKYTIRPDGSTYHHFIMNINSGEPVRGHTWQGFSDESCWSRGHSWMIYGSAIMYAYTGDESWIDTFEKVTDYFVNHLPEDYVSHWDFDVIGTGDDDRDSSATAITLCGILEMANCIGATSRKMPVYIDTAKKMLSSLIDNYAVRIDSGKEGLLDKTMGAKPFGSVPGCSTYGDYYYFEALVRASTPWKMYW